MQVEVIDLCVLLQCVGFKIKSLESARGETNSQDPALGRTVDIVCNHSGLRVVLECESTECSCPASQDEQSSGFWQVSGVSNGVVQTNKESGSSLVGTLPPQTKCIITRELHKLLQYSRNQADPELAAKTENKITRCVLFNELSVDHTHNKTSSLKELNITPNDERMGSKLDTPTRYRSLDTLTNIKNMDGEIPAPGRLVAKTPVVSDTSDLVDDLPQKPKASNAGPIKRQQTYTMSTPDKNTNIMMKSKTSSPIGKLSEAMLQSLMGAEKTAEELKNKLAALVKQATVREDNPNDSSVASLALDVSKISCIQKVPDPPTKNKFVSSPNISGMSKRHDGRTSLKRNDSSSTSQLNVRNSGIKPPSRLKRLSPSFFRLKKDDSAKQNGDGTFRKISEKTHNKFTSMLKPRMSLGTSPGGFRTPPPKPCPNENGPSISLSTGKKKSFNHVKSTIPKPSVTSKKD